MHKGYNVDARFYYRAERRGASLYVCSVGHEISLRGYRWGPGARSYYLLHHVVRGRGSFVYQGRRYPLRAGDTFAAFPGVPLTLESAPGDAPWEYLWVGFMGGESALLLGNLGLTDKTPVCFTGQDETLAVIHGEIYRARGPRLCDSTAMTGKLYLLFSHLLAQQPERADADGDHLQHALTYISDHASENIAIEDVCRAVGVSRSWLYRIFMRDIGLSPVRYLTSQKITRACGMLSATRMRVSEIAWALGYDDPLYFSRVFHTVMGVSPAAYRKTHHSSEIL